MGGILETAGITGFLGNLTTFYEDVVDDDSKLWHALVQAWWTQDAEQTVGVQQIWQLTQGTNGVDLDLGDKSEKSQRSKLGRLLARLRDRIFDGRRVTAAPPLKGAARWRLRPPSCTSRTRAMTRCRNGRKAGGVHRRPSTGAGYGRCGPYGRFHPWLHMYIPIFVCGYRGKKTSLTSLTSITAPVRVIAKRP